MNLYRQSIALFGIALPVGLAVALVGAAFYVHSSFQSSAAEKVAGFNTYQATSASTSNLMAKAQGNRSTLEQWSGLMKQEAVIAVPTHLREIAGKLPSREFQQTAFDRAESKSGFGSVSAQKSSQINLSLRGTFRTVQQAFLELETKMPQLQLQSLKITPPATAAQAGAHNFQVTYTAWEN